MQRLKVTKFTQFVPRSLLGNVSLRSELSPLGPKVIFPFFVLVCFGLSKYVTVPGSVEFSAGLDSYKSFDQAENNPVTQVGKWQ